MFTSETAQYTSTRGYSDNPNPKAKIGFLVFYAFQFYVQKNIYKEIEEESEFIVDLTAYFPVRQPDDLVRDIIGLLRKHGVRYRILHYEDRFSETYLEEFLSPYQVLVSLWQRGAIMLRCASAIRKVHPLYGTGKELVMVHPSRGIFDLTLVYGRHSQKFCSIYGEAKTVGNPKFDDWFNDEVDLETIEFVRKDLDPNKRTILYLPTHGDLCSIDQIADPLKDLTRAYNVITKLHYFTIREERERIGLLEGDGILLLKDDVDLLPLLKIADVVLSDNSSAIFDAILADKPLVTTNFLDKEYLDQQHKKLRTYRRGRMGAITYSGSIEQVIKQEKLVVTVDTPDELADSIGLALKDEQYYVDARKKLRNQLFDFNDGKCGQRAAAAIRDLITLPELPPRPIMYHALEAYKRSMNISGYDTVRSLQKKLNEYESALFVKGTDAYPFFSIVIIDEHPEQFEETLRTLLWQKYPPEKFEVLVISEGYDQEKIKRAQSVRDGKVSVTRIGLEKGLLPGVLIQEALRQARGNILVFTKSGYVIPYDWLSRYAIWFYKLPHIVAAGGHEGRVPNSERNRFVEFGDYSISRKLGLRKKLPPKSFYPVVNREFYRNPAGILSNVAYMKMVLANADFIPSDTVSWNFIEQYLKKRVFQSGEVAYIPNPVSYMVPPDYAEFRKRNIEYGMMQGSRGPMTSFAGILKETTIGFLDNEGKGRWSLTWTIAQAAYFQWVGYWFTRLGQLRMRYSKW